VSDFGDFDPDDAWALEPPDPEQVTYRLHHLRAELDLLAAGRDVPTWDQLDPDAQAMALGIGQAVVAYIVEREPEDAASLARTLHDARRYVATSPLPPWDELPADDRQVGIDLMQTILDWLARQGALDAA
jgi:hypothetical protein